MEGARERPDAYVRRRMALIASACDGCGDAMIDSCITDVWVSTPNGLHHSRTHIGCEEEAAEALIFANGGGRRVVTPTLAHASRHALRQPI
jgi:hypothetical protein